MKKILALLIVSLSLNACVEPITPPKYSISSSGFTISDTTDIENDILNYGTLALIGENSQGNIIMSIYQNQKLVYEMNFSKEMNLSDVLSTDCIIIQGVNNSKINARYNKDELKKLVITNSNKALVNLEGKQIINRLNQTFLIQTNEITHAI
ncbi:MAG: hypothetical protein U0354_15630 [Candidatus Sericytochromatia bacterium]